MEDFMEKATNVYRTKHFIVKQILNYEEHEKLDNIIISQDSFYKRTKIRDKQYNKIFAEKVNIDGKRIKTASSTRNYID